VTNILHNFSESYTQVISAQTVYLVIARALHVHYFAKFPIFSFSLHELLSRIRTVQSSERLCDIFALNFVNHVLL